MALSFSSLGMSRGKNRSLSDRSQQVKWWIEVLLLRCIWAVSRLLPVDRASSLGGRLFRRIGPGSPKHKKIRRNLEIALPERKAEEIEAIASGVWESFGRALAEYPHLPKICALDEAPRIEVVKTFDPAMFEGRPIIFVAAHLANWNVPAVVGRHLDIPLSVLFRRRDNPLLENAIDHWRGTMPAGFIDVGDSPAREMFAELREGRSIGLFIDRRVKDGDIIPFFDVDAETSTVPARLAIKLGTAIVPVETERLQDARFRLTLHPPIFPDPKVEDAKLAAKRMTIEVHQQFERWIRSRPSSWLCSSRRWPKEKPRPSPSN